MGHPKYVNIGDPVTRLIEECSELIQALCKAQRFGWMERHPKTGKRNDNAVLDEIKDVQDRIREFLVYIGEKKS